MTPSDPKPSAISHQPCLPSAISHQPCLCLFLFLYPILALALGNGTAAQSPGRVTGPIPLTLPGAARALWIAAGPDAGSVRCDVSAPHEWSCDGLVPDARGLVVLVGDGAVATLGVGLSGLGTDVAVAKWGRVVHVTAGAAAPEDLHDLLLTAWTPERSRARPQTRRFTPIKDDHVQTARVSETSFWVSGNEVDPDAFVALDGPAIGRSRMSTIRLSEGVPDDPIFLPATTPVTLAGHIHGPHGEEAGGAGVELFGLLDSRQIGDAMPERLDERTPLLLERSVIASPDGSFQFDGVSIGPFRIAASHSSLGSGGVWVALVGPPVDIALTLAPKVKARVLRHGLPVPAARVRFLPDPDAWAASVDPTDHVTEQTRTADDGTFALPLPRKPAGTIQVLLDDGTGVRVVVPNLQTTGDVLLGDLTVPDQRRLVVRLLDGSTCDLLAVGPLGALGLNVVRAASRTGLYELELPDAGSWALNAECRGVVYEIEPPIIAVPADGQPPAVDALVVKRRGD
ncbi:MAG: hypothetical protein DMF95_27715 [Acidobacteria bacterium]|nr:MAG: hypothetical protein DMF95_27715 [Acidobacteriota bacterium]